MKDIIRKKSIHSRNQLDSNQVDKLSNRICRQIIDHEIFKNSHVVAMYYPYGNEASLKTLFKTNKKMVLPVVFDNNRMTFRHFSQCEALETNQYGIPEPVNGELIQHKDIDLCLLPLTVFDRQGHRIGMGGGYYDRYFELNKFQKKPTILAGVAYDFQESDTICPEPWDIPLDIIFTNHETIQI